MKLKLVGANQTEIFFASGLVVFFSFSVPVAARLVNNRYYASNSMYSSTTAWHINKWLGGVKPALVSQEYLESLIEGV